ncbi:MAG: diacylglycerol kinase family protein [Bacteroidota bacterium]|nr:diacylglycerol kinase family protein [Bacteroidota bacterium]
MTKFSIRNRIKSFKYAFKGVFYVFKTQHNAWIHLSILALVVFFGLFFRISILEWIAVVVVSGFVLMAEIFNTVIEVFLDKFHPARDETIGVVKDIAAGAVLIAAIAAAITGLLIFVPKIIVI